MWSWGEITSLNMKPAFSIMMLLDSYCEKKKGYNKVLEEFIVVLWILVQQWVLLYQPICGTGEVWAGLFFRQEEVHHSPLSLQTWRTLY